jgi:hypothetical protein
MIGGIVTGLKVAWRLKDVKRAISEMKDVVVSVNALTAAYRQAQADGKITPEEAERLVVQVGAVARNGMEAKEVLEQIF